MMQQAIDAPICRVIRSTVRTSLLPQSNEKRR
nr:MAG TPA: hypothetical protein [Caudoviricetes sp.]